MVDISVSPSVKPWVRMGKHRMSRAQDHNRDAVTRYKVRLRTRSLKYLVSGPRPGPEELVDSIREMLL